MRAPTQGFDLSNRPIPLRRLLTDVWNSRQLLAVLARKDFFVKYRRASFGLMWAVGLPVFQAAVMAFVFSRVVSIDTDVNYVVFVYSGFVAWSFFSSTLSSASTAIVDGSMLSSRIYFPRAVLPLATVGTNVYGFVVNIAVLVLFCLLFGVSLGVQLLWLVPAFLLAVSLAAAFSLFASAVHVYFRDIRYIVAALISAWFYVTPVLYPLDLAPGALEVVVRANPLTGVVELFRLATVGADAGWPGTVGVSCLWIAVVGIAALVLHHRFDRVFSDLL